VLLGAVAFIFVAAIGAFVIDLIIQARPAFAHFGFAFIIGTQWNPVTAQYGALPFIVGTLETTVIAMVLALVVGLGAAISLSHLLPGRLRMALGSAVELLAAIPSVVYGLWGLLVVAPWARTIIEPAIGAIFDHKGPASGSEIGFGLLLAGLILFVMVLPTMIAISRDVLAAVPNEQIEGAYALGATRWQVVSRECPDRTAWCRDARDGTRSRRDDGGHDGDRQHAVYRAFALCSSLDNGIGYREPVHRGDRTVPSCFACRCRGALACDLYPRQFHGSAPRALDRPFSQRDRVDMSVMTMDPILERRAEVQRIASGSLHRRQYRSVIAIVLCIACVAVALVPLIAIVGYTVERGIGAWSLAFFSHLPTPAGIPGGGIKNSIIGSVLIDALAVAGALPVGVLTGLCLAESNGRVASGVRFAADVMSGVPSILIGVFAYGLLVVTLRHFSAAAASFAIGFLMLPVIIRASETAIRTVPHDLTEAALSLGGKKASIARRVIVPTALPGLVTGLLLAISRGVGETAPLLFTAIGSQYLSLSIFGPMAALPLTVYQDGIQAYPDIQQTAWGAALLLLLLVFLLSVTARIVSARLGRSRHA
jgi:phosphate transport system permease protein